MNLIKHLRAQFPVLALSTILFFVEQSHGHGHGLKLKAQNNTELPPAEIGLRPLHDNARSWGRVTRYYASTFSVDAHTASDYCRKMGMELLAIETDWKQREVERYMVVNEVNGRPWLSGTAFTDNNWEWAAGEPMYYKNFVDWQGDDGINTCMMIRGMDQSDRFKWTREYCRENNPFLCER